MILELNPTQWAKLSAINSLVEEPMEKTVYDCIEAGLGTYDKLIATHRSRCGITAGVPHDP